MRKNMLSCFGGAALFMPGICGCLFASAAFSKTFIVAPAANIQATQPALANKIPDSMVIDGSLYSKGSYQGLEIMTIAIQRLHKFYGDKIEWMTGLEICRRFAE